VSWIPSSYVLPEVGQFVVVLWTGGGTVWAGKYLGIKQTFDYWMPLPEFP
jgi:hypothetical protein